MMQRGAQRRTRPHPLQVPVDAVVAPPGVLAHSGHLEVAVLRGVEVHVRQLAHAPVHVQVKLPLGSVEVNVDWGMSKLPDMDLNTPEDGHFKMTAVGQNARWGDYSINRNLQWGSSSRRLSLDLTGDAEFGAGPLAASSPVQTEVKL